MARKTIGYMELEWTCPNCGTNNKGAETTCSGCGAAQPDNVEFHAPLKQEMVQDQADIEQAKAGPDIHCAYCGARNPAGTLICTNCGADLSEGKTRKTGRVIGAFRSSKKEEIPCPACGANNPSSNLKCAQCGSALHPATQSSSLDESQPEIPVKSRTNTSRLWIPILAIAGIGIVIFLILLFQQKDTGAAVTQRLWERTVSIEQFGPVKHQDWRSELPSGAAILSCEQELRNTSNEPVANSREVCGTPYSVDKGSGYAEVVTDCVYEVYEDYCNYNVDEWSVVDNVSSSGQDGMPAWPETQLASNQRMGDQSEDYRIVFDINGEQKTYTTSDAVIYEQAAIGSQWTLTINGLGQIIDLEPSN
jgi:DNA-directed RNA polymerase subunit RPC12/RpoP